MATANALFRAKARVEVKTAQVTAYDAATTYSLTINGKSVTTIAAGSVNATATALAAAWNAATEGEFAEVTASANTDTVTLTHDTAGVPFTVASSVSGGTGTIGAVSTTTAATGPTFWDNVNNWDTGAVPVNGDTANVDLSLGSFTDGFAQSAVTLAALNIVSPQFTTNALARPKLNPNGYTEYRATGLAIGATATKIDCGSALVNINYGSVQNSTEVRRSGQASAGVPAVLLRGTNGSNAIDVQGNCSVGLAYYDGESYNAASSTFASGSQVVAGSGAVLADTISNAALAIMQGTGTNWQTAGGVSDIRGTPGFSVLHADGGSTIAKFGGTIADVVVGGSGGTLDASQDNTERVFTNCSMDRGGQIIDPNETITFTNGIDREPGVSNLTAV